MTIVFKISATLALGHSPPVCSEEDSLTDLVADMRAEHGVPSAEAYAWADQVLGLTGQEGCAVSAGV
jgi:hypothetical protein